MSQPKSYAEELREVASEVKQHPAINNMATRTIGHVLKDIATGPAVYDWLAHGANELANAALKGQIAPIYTRSYSTTPTAGGVHGPDDDANSPQGTATVHGPEQQPELPGNGSIINDLIANTQELASQPEQEREVEK